MKNYLSLCLLAVALLVGSGCVSKKKALATESELASAKADLQKYIERVRSLEAEVAKKEANLAAVQSSSQVRNEQVEDLKRQLEDAKKVRDQQITQVGDLTVLSQSANNNIAETLSQLERKDKYINLLQAAKTKADSINLALAVNLKGVLAKGIADEDVDIKVDKTVVFVNLSDKMLYKSGSYELTDRAGEVLGKIAKIIESRPELEVMVEGYTDNQPINTIAVKDNWDLSVKRATSVVRALQTTYGIDPNRLIAAGRGQYNTLATNDTAEGRAMNRRTRIIILPKLNQFYDLLNPTKVPN